MMTRLSNMSILVGNQLWNLNGAFQFDFDVTPNSTLEVLQNVYEIWSTPLGSQPLLESFGTDQGWIGLPGNIQTFAAQTAFLLSVAQWEPRATFNKIQFTLDTTDVMAGSYSLYCELEIDLSVSINANLFGAPVSSPTWVIDNTITGNVPTVLNESLTL